ncbi:MAG TPA: Smr/MutS family protein [Paenalcaligenes sp.]|nr:Smr/MutS family protein [Paenalcaligenes sp.]
MKVKPKHHAQLHALRRRLRQRATGAEPLAGQKQSTSTPASRTQTTKTVTQSPHPKTKVRKKLSTGFDRTNSALSASDRSLFQEAMRSVQPLRTSARHIPTPDTVAPAATPQQLEERRLRAESHHHELFNAQLSDHYDAYSGTEHIQEYLNPICGTDVLRNLRRGQWPLEASIDLHGATLDRARERLQSFLQHCFAEEHRCIRIVHGKGYGSANKEPVLLYQIRRWLTQLPQVLAFCDCAPNEGGQGAVKVLLRKSR